MEESDELGIDVTCDVDESALLALGCKIEVDEEEEELMKTSSSSLQAPAAKVEPIEEK
jgi:hypothetical protein